ncbi:MAG TPA: PASTA domain-containing protein [Cyclobacteriaceae bacterium]|nr:PASTA domain-containing protein [Cyclobacteriaceae bacterium]
MFSILKKYNNSTLGGILIHLVLACSLLFILALLYFYWYLPSVTNKGESITVPNIEGIQIDKLEEVLGERNLRWEVDDSSYSEKYPPLTVLKQFPHAGAQVKENRNIYISINRINPPTVPLPNLVDRSVTNAEAVLKSNELKRGHIELVSGPFLNVVQSMKFEGRPIKEGTKVPKGSSIDLVVMDGGNKDVQAPNVVGYSLEDAKVPIFGYNLNLGTIHLVGDTTGVDPVVLKQKPEAYETIKVGDIVDLWIGKKGTEVPAEDE